MVKRNENGKLKFSSLDFEILIGDLLIECKNDDEINWLEYQLKTIVEGIAQEARDGVL